MAITVLSPFSGSPVNVREQDVGRAVRDAEGRVFYVLQRSSGEGWYVSMTRAGGAAEEQRYLEIEARAPAAALDPALAPGTPPGAGVAYDATGQGRTGIPGRRVLMILGVIVVGVVLVGIWLYRAGPMAPHAPSAPATRPANP